MESTPLSVLIHTLGCKVNQAESEAMERDFARLGFSIHRNGRQATNVVILNTCTVTGVADRKARQWLRRARHDHPDALIIATGCYAARAPEQLGRTGVVDLVVGNDQKGQLASIAAGRLGGGSLPLSEGFLALEGGRTRSMVKIQDGCTASCAYCIVPAVRPRPYSLPPQDIVKQVKELAGAGYKEVVLTGTEVGSYDYGGIRLEALLRLVLAETGITRLRLSSLQPHEISDSLSEVWRDDRMCPHFHIALQSGCDATLSAMKRRYNTARFRSALESIRRNVPDAAVTTDIIAGFPGETADQFQESLLFCRQAGFAAIHVFPFSPRPGTLAASMPGAVPEPRKWERTQALLNIAREAGDSFRKRFIGRELRVLWENETAPGSGLWTGLTGNYLRVLTCSLENLGNRVMLSRLLSLHANGIWAETLTTIESAARQV